MKISIDRPVAGHLPHVGKSSLGRSPGQNRVGTVLSCSCGFCWKTNEKSPGRGGKAEANVVYREHVAA